jgi:fructose-1-phosphate kinase PfkB-like protein
VTTTTTTTTEKNTPTTAANNGRFSMNLRLFLLAMSIMPSQQLTSPIVVVGLNGALQKRFVLSPGDNLVPGNVHRAVVVQEGVGGKGQDVSIALNCLSNKSPQQLVQFLGRGPAGDAVHQILEEMLGKEAMELTVRSSADLRTCTSIVAFDETTELVEPSGDILKDEMQELYRKVSAIGNQARGVCIMGSMPPGCDAETYAKLYSQVAGPSTVCVVDSVAGIEALFQTASGMGTKSGPIIFKINASELCAVAGVPKSTSETGGVDKAVLTTAVRHFIVKYSPHASNALLGLAVTDGRHPAHFVTLADQEEFQLFQIQVPTLDSGRTLYPIGAGDAVAAGTLAAWVSLTAPESSYVEVIPKECFNLLTEGAKQLESVTQSPDVGQAIAAFSFGLVCGSASCLQEENSVLNVADVQCLYQALQSPQLISKQPITA